MEARTCLLPQFEAMEAHQSQRILKATVIKPGRGFTERGHVSQTLAFVHLACKGGGSTRLHSLEEISDRGFLSSRKLKSITLWLRAYMNMTVAPLRPEDSWS